MAGKIKDRRRVGDFWTSKAKSEDYPARSVYKLKEADKKYKLLKPGLRVLDLGCAPGSWTLYAAERVGPTGLVVGVDLQPVEGRFSENTRIIQADVLGLSPEILQIGAPFDVVLSDMAPRTSGIRSTDQARSLELAQAAVDLAGNLLITGGTIFFKVFQSPDAEVLFRDLKKEFRILRRVKPESSRKISVEIFFLGLGFSSIDKEGV